MATEKRENPGKTEAIVRLKIANVINCLVFIMDVENIPYS